MTRREKATRLFTFARFAQFNSLILREKVNYQKTVVRFARETVIINSLTLRTIVSRKSSFQWFVRAKNQKSLMERHKINVEIKNN